jgi:transposase-like protein
MDANRREINSLQDAIQHFSDEQVCIDEVSAMRWPSGKPECPACGHPDHYWLAKQRRWKCKECWKQFSVKVGTVFEDSPLSLTKWLPALWLVVNCKNGISSYELGKALKISQKSAWFMLHRLRLALREGVDSKMGGSGPVEVDETFVGGKTKNMHRERRLRMQTAEKTYQKAIVMGMLDRESRRVRAAVIPNVKRETLQNAILNQIEGGATVYTDGYQGYDNLAAKEYIHETVNHVEEYVRGQIHTQGIENFWSLLKRTLSGTYVAVEPFHLDRYLDEQMFRYNNRATKDNPLNDADRFSALLMQLAGKRLTYAELTGKVEATPF